MSPELRAFAANQLATPCPPEAREFAEALAKEAGARAALFYGSVLRTGDLEGVLDFYILTGDAPGKGWRGWLSRHLWPDVSFRELRIGGRTVRAKVATMRLSTFARAAGDGHLDTTIWTRFVQPSALVWAADAEAEDAVTAAITAACTTAGRYAAALGPDSGRAEDYWLALFRNTYKAELRVEKPGREREILRYEPQRYEQVLPLAWASGGIAFSASDGVLKPELSPETARRLRRAWARRARFGKPLNAARLIKAPSTFEGAARYAAWKIERHTGVAIAVTPWRERHPVLAAPGVAWTLWRARKQNGQARTPGR